MKFKQNQKGGATVVAILVVILLVCVGTAALIITGRKTIESTNAVPAAKAADKNNSSSSSQTDSSDTEEPEEPETANPYPVKADDYKDIKDKSITSKYSILMDANSGQIIAGHNYDQKIYPASLTKMLTLLVAVENIDDLKATYTFTAKDIDPLVEANASRADFAAGEKVTMNDLLYASVLVSGADGTLGLAKSIAGSEAGFVKLMNQKIEELGLTGTEFVNASGLHNKKHYSTVQDIAIITRECLNNETCRKVLTTKTYTTSKTKQHKNGIKLESIVLSRLEGYYIDTNKDDKADADIIGGKSGFTDEAMFTLSTICEYNDTTYICVTARSSGQDICTQDQIAIYEKYLPKDEVQTEEDESSSNKSSDNSKAA